MRFESKKSHVGNGIPILLVLAWLVAVSAAAYGPLARAAGGKKATLTVWEYYSSSPAKKGLKDFSALFHKKHPNVHVKYVFIPYQHLPEKVIAAAGAQSGPDIVVYNDTDVASFAQAGAITNLTKRWRQFKGSNQFPSQAVHRISGKVYGIQGYTNLLALYYNENILKKVGIKPPHSIAQLAADLKKIRKSSGNYVGLTLSGKANDQGEWQAFPWLTAYGWSYHHPDVGACKKALTHIQKWSNNGSIPSEASNWGQVQPFNRFLVGNVAFAENGNWELISARHEADFKYGVTVLPSGTKSPGVYLGGEVVSIGAFSKHPALAWDFIRSTYLSRKGELDYFHDTRSLPARKDVRMAIGSDPLIDPFKKEVSQYGHSYPPSVSDPMRIKQAELAVAKHWSEIIAGQENAGSACRHIASSVKKILSGGNSGLLQ